MVFSDLFFIFGFIPAFALLYLMCGCIDRSLLSRGREEPRFTLRNLTLVVFSLLFYAWGEPIYVFLMLVCVIINYFAGLGIAYTRHRKTALVIGVVANLVLLGVFKYLGFFGDVLTSVGLRVNTPHLALPIGISFYVFQSISYLVDVYRGEAPAQRRFFDLLLYIALFPQLIAGPIVRYGSIAHEIHHRKVSADDLAEGIYRFVVGLSKKVILANIFSEIAEMFLAQYLNDLSIWGAWIGLIAFTLQIYFDFSGYSDMAIGIGRSVGFHFCENFNHPYCSRTITDFWRRWHMSLGSFFRDYAYIPMGGNRRHQPINILTVWFLTGMWHGASWNFIIWGLYYGLVLVFEKFTIIRWQSKIPRVVLHFYALLVIVVGWGFFYFTDFGDMTTFFNSLLGRGSLQWSYIEQQALLDYFWLWVAGILLCMPVRKMIEGLADSLACRTGGASLYLSSAIRAVISVVLLVVCVALLVGATNNAFIYTRF